MKTEPTEAFCERCENELSISAKMQFFDEAIKAKRHIAAFHFNDVFLEFADKFYLRKPHKVTIDNFKK